MGTESDRQQNHDVIKMEANPAFTADLNMAFIQTWLQEEEWERGRHIVLVTLRGALA